MPRLSKRAIFIREFASLAEHWFRKAFIRLCFDDEDSSEDDIDYHILAELAVMGISRGSVNDYVIITVCMYSSQSSD